MSYLASLVCPFCHHHYEEEATDGSEEWEVGEKLHQRVKPVGLGFISGLTMYSTGHKVNTDP